MSFKPPAVCPSICSRVSVALLARRVMAATFTHRLSRGKEEELGDSSWGRSPTYGLQCNVA